MEVTINDTKIENALSQAFDMSMEIFQRRLIQEFTSNKWEWPQGQSPRDIINTGRLRGATLAAEQAKLHRDVYEWTWNVEYALAVYFGATFKDGTEFPARPWAQKPLEDLPDIYNRVASGMLGGL